MVKIRNVFGDEYKGRQGNAVYQKFYGRQIRRLWDGKKENTAPQQEEQKRRFRVGLAFWESLSTAEREKLREYLRGIGSDLTAQQWAVKVALSRPRVTVQQEEVLANLVEWVEGWDAIGWTYRQKITLTNDLSTDLVGYQKLLELDASKVGPHFRWDLLGADLRFYDDQGNKLSYWVEEWDKENKTAKVWVRVSRIPAQGSTSIKMYYGNAQAESESDAKSVFDLYDDFEDYEVGTTNPNDWTCVQSNYNSYSITVREDNGRKVLEIKGVASDSHQRNRYIYAKHNVTVNAKSIIEFCHKENTNHSHFRVKVIVDGNKVLSMAGTKNNYITSSVTVDGIANYIEIGHYFAGLWSGAIISNLDWVRVRKYAEQEPTAEFGSEEVGQQVTHTTTRVTVKAIEHVAIADVRVFDEDGNEVWRAEGLTDIAGGKVTSRVRLPDEVVKEGVRALVRSAAGTVDVVNL